MGFSFGELFGKVAASMDDDLEERVPVEPQPLCADCRRSGLELNEDGLCRICVEEHAQGYRIRSLAGRCANGAQRDSGRLFHAVPLGSWKAVCGTGPGRQSAGWSEWGRGGDVTCPRCASRIKNRKIS